MEIYKGMAVWKYTIEVNGMMCGMCGVHINDAVRKAFPVKKVTSSRGKKQTVVLSDGTVAEEGSPKDLEEKNGVYIW